ncbi:substrate-binding periplasmic protein [Shewanella morhuae]|uniref:Bacterial extracellular solute-binding proteins, family 3 n=1 Tax=Shewanella morhuae TaxID=365591 RepID=A0A379ZEK8_9GAMM|nr:transporter substrate-binding domain-containing protein [Shewanella morhuae]SUI59736.1 Bacterial extracellular solute-binding proteins, family 3 [Shewanella morhuae]
MAIYLTVAMRIMVTEITRVIGLVIELSTKLSIIKRTVYWSLFITALTGLSTLSSFSVLAAVTTPSYVASNSDSTQLTASSIQSSVSKTIVTTIQQTWQLNLLKEALRRSDSTYQVLQMSTQMNQKRKVEEALAGTVDVFWSMTSKELEQTVLPVRIPLFKGLLGNRLLIIRKSDEARFANVKTMADFKQLKAGQNRYWPDASILEANKIPLVTSYQYTNLYPMLEGGRFDYLALGAQEVGEELASHPDSALKIDSHILLQYRSPAYFFVSPKRPELAAAILAGLESMILDGSFDEMFNRELKIEQLYREAKFEQRVIIRLDTPDLSPLTPIERKELWLDLFSMQGTK